MRSGRKILKRLALRLVIYYVLGCVVLAICLGELAIHPAHGPVARDAVHARATKLGIELQDVSIAAEDRVQLRGWFVRPAKASGNAVILLHGIGDTRLGMAGLAELFASMGYAVLIPDSRGHGESGGFPTYGIKETGDVRKWYDWLKENARTQCVFGLGESMGRGDDLAPRSVFAALHRLGCEERKMSL